MAKVYDLKASKGFAEQLGETGLDHAMGWTEHHPSWIKSRPARRAAELTGLVSALTVQSLVGAAGDKDIVEKARAALVDESYNDSTHSAGWDANRRPNYALLSVQGRAMAVEEGQPKNWINSEAVVSTAWQAARVSIAAFSAAGVDLELMLSPSFKEAFSAELPANGITVHESAIAEYEAQLAYAHRYVRRAVV